MNRTQTLDIYIGKNTKVGTLSLPVGTETEFSFRYEEKWKQVGFPISPHIPFDDSAPSRSIENYLRNLLPEGDSLRQLCESTTISRNNTFGLVRAMGAETSGALSFRDSGAQPIETSFRLVPEDELARRLEHSMDPLVFWDGKIRLSVAGVQSKLSLLRNNDEWGVWRRGSLL